MASWILLTGFLFIQGCFSAVIVDVSPRENVVLPRQNVTFQCRVGVPLQYCRVEIPGMGTLNLNHKLPPRNGVSYFGAGLSAGQCGFTIDSVQDINNGKIKCFLGMETDSDESMGTMQLTVARPPKSPELDVSRGADSLRVYKINDILQASCIVKDGRPVANISWFLDDEPIYGEGLSMPTIIDFAKEDLHSKVQNMTRILQPSDNGKLLKCVASHPTLKDGSFAARPLDVKYPPLPLSNPIDKFGYVIGQAGIISIEIDANPKPQLEWTVRSQKIREGSIDNTGRIESESAQDMGRGHYIANLRIAAISKQDTETQYILTAYNDMGRQDYTILISTSPEPEGLELGVATIVAVICSLLVILVIVFMVVFARITGRWCFSASSRDTIRPVGESSDTESADPRPKEKRRILPNLPPLKLTKPNINLSKINIFKKKDKVTSVEDEVKTLSEDEVKIPLEDETREEINPVDKEGIVYAELDLVGPNLRPVVKSEDDKTEYAEIVYTQNEAEKKIEDASKPKNINV